MKIKVYFLFVVWFLVVCLITSCTGKKDSVAIYSLEPMLVDVYESKADRTFNITIYYLNQYVTKMIAEEKYVLKEGKIEDLNKLSLGMILPEDNEYFNFDGFTQTITTDENTFTATYTYDYEIIDIKEQIIKENGMISPLIIDDNYKVVYKKLEDELIKEGLKKEGSKN